MTFRIVPFYTGPALSPDVTYDVLYTVLGGTDGPQRNRFSITGTKAEFDSEELASTSSSKKTLTVKVTDVLAQ